jgi:hypothetical protein
LEKSDVWVGGLWWGWWGIYNGGEEDSTMPTSMQRSFVVVLVLVGLVLAAGAQGGGAAAAVDGWLLDSFVYALHDSAAGNEIYGFRADGASGTLTALPGFPVATGGSGDPDTVVQRLAYDAASGRLFALNAGSDTLSAYRVNLASGALAALPYHNRALGAGWWQCLAVQPGGGVVVAGSTDGGGVRSFAVSDTALAEAPGSPYATAGSDYSCAFSRDGRFVYTGVSAVYGFVVDGATGALAALPGSPYGLGATPVAYATDGAGRLFLADFGANALRVATSRGGVLSEVAGSPFVSGLTYAAHGLVHPAGFYVVADPGENRVGVYRIGGTGAGTTLAAVAGSPFATGAPGPYDSHILALGQGGRFLYVANAVTRSIGVFAVDGATGALASRGGTAADNVGTDGRVTGLVAAPVPAGGRRVLVHTDDPVHVGPASYPEQALVRLGMPYHATYDWEQATFVAKLESGAWDVVIFTVDEWVTDPGVLDALLGYVDGGGRLIVYDRWLDVTAGHAFWAALGVSFRGNIVSPAGVNVPVYQWDGTHPVFRFPEVVPSPLDWVSRGFTGGQRVAPLAGSRALAGYTVAPAASEAALVVGNGGRTIYKAFGEAWHDDSDHDGDGVADVVELWVDLIVYMSERQVFLPVVVGGG